MYSSQEFSLMVSSSVETGGGPLKRSPPPPRNRKNCCRNLGLSSRGIYIYSERSQLSKKDFAKMWKSPFSIEILMKNFLNFLSFFKTFCVSCPNAQNLACIYLNFACPMKIFLRRMIIRFATDFSRFSPTKLKYFHQISNSSFRSAIFEFFW